jgi:hypothetical protein
LIKGLKCFILKLNFSLHKTLLKKIRLFYMKKILTILFIVLLHITANAHPLHVSITNVEYDAEKKVFIVSVKLFHDDFQGVIYHLYGINLKLGTTEEHPEANGYIDKYMRDNFDITFGKKQKKSMKLSEKTLDDMYVWIKMEIKPPSEFESIDVRNSLMNDYFLDQSNLLILIYKEKQFAEKFTYNLIKASFKLN